jgi:hypothetical protein
VSGNVDLSFDGPDVRARVARWLEEAERLIGAMQTARALTDRTHAAEQRAAWLDRQVALLLDENRRLRDERRDIADAARTLVDFQKLNYVLERLST